MSNSGRVEIEPFGRTGAATMGQHRRRLAVRLFKTCVQGAGNGVADPGDDSEEKRKGQNHGVGRYHEIRRAAILHRVPSHASEPKVPDPSSTCFRSTGAILRVQCFDTVSYTHLTLPTKRIV